MLKKLDKLVSESVNKFLLREFYSAPLYHATCLGSAWKILLHGSISANIDGDGCCDSRIGNRPFVALARSLDSKYVKKTYPNTVIFVVDPQRLMNGSIKNARLLPFDFMDNNYEEWQRRELIRKSGQPLKAVSESEMEERFYGDIPLSSVTSVIIKIKNLSQMDYRSDIDSLDAESDEYDLDTDFGRNLFLLNSIQELCKKHGIKIIK